MSVKGVGWPCCPHWGSIKGITLCSPFDLSETKFIHLSACHQVISPPPAFLSQLSSRYPCSHPIFRYCGSPQEGSHASPSVPSARFWKASAPGQTLMDGQLHLHLAVSLILHKAWPSKPHISCIFRIRGLCSSSAVSARPFPCLCSTGLPPGLSSRTLSETSADSPLKGSFFLGEGLGFLCRVLSHRGRSPFLAPGS